jgi:hypothetical protein
MLRWNKGLQPAIHSTSAESETSAPRLLRNSRALAYKKLTSVAALSRTGPAFCSRAALVPSITSRNVGWPLAEKRTGSNRRSPWSRCRCAWSRFLRRYSHGKNVNCLMGAHELRVRSTSNGYTAGTSRLRFWGNGRMTRAIRRSSAAGKCSPSPHSATVCHDSAATARARDFLVATPGDDPRSFFRGSISNLTVSQLAV